MNLIDKDKEHLVLRNNFRGPKSSLSPSSTEYKTIDRPNGKNRSVADQESTIIAKEASLCAIASMASDPIHLLVVVPSMAFLGHVLPYTGMSDAKIAVNVPRFFFKKLK